MATMSLARIDEEITRHVLVLSNLGTQRNSLTCVFRLPTEILQTIFIHCARDHHEDHKYPSFYMPSWVNVSYVCNHWRNVALNCPTLWTYVSAISQRWTEELLARSKQAPLKIRIIGCGKYESWWSNFVEKVVIHVERIQEFYLCIWDPFVQRSFLSLFPRFSSRAPRLKNLEIEVIPGINLEGFPVFFRGDTPTLRTLELSHCPVRWNSFLRLSGLTTLSLDHVPVHFQQNMVEFQALLSGMQDLTHLYLDHALSRANGVHPSEVCNASSKINLPRLSRLLVVAPLSTVVALLSCVNIPLEAEVRLQCHVEPGLDADSDYSSLSSLLAQRSGMAGDQALSGPIIRSLHIECIETRLRFAFSALERDCDIEISVSDAEWNCNILLMIVVDLNPRTMERDEDRVIWDICCFMPLTNVQSLHLVHPPCSPVFWRKMLGRLQDLWYIGLRDGDVRAITSILSPTPNNCTENQRTWTQI